MIKCNLFLLCLLIPLCAISQTQDIASEEVFTAVEKMPEFIGGEDKLFEYLADNIHYSNISTESYKGKVVYVQFVINGKGSIIKPKVVRGVNPVLDAEALRVIKSMPNWKPGEYNEKPVSVLLMLPVKFAKNKLKLEKDSQKTKSISD